MRRPFAKTLMSFAAISVFAIGLTQAIIAADPLPRVPPKEPAEALKTFVCRDGFEMQLIAAEPLVVDPVASEYDENGRAYVCEMRDYPYTDKASDKPFIERTTDEPLGRVRLLEDTDGDGVFDKSTVFAEGLSWPTGLALWDGGVYVVATPDLWYLKDTDGDGKADVRRKVLTGFRKFNVQAVINNLKWGLDGKIYGAGSSNGGQIRRGEVGQASSLSDSKPTDKLSDKPTNTDRLEARPTVMTTADFRFDPRDEAGSFELLSGGARFGNAFDDWGNRFICNIRNPIQHVVLPREYLARNPQWPARSALQDVAVAGDTIPVFRISPPEPWRVVNSRRLASDATLASPRSETVAAGYMTSASGLTIYRGDAYPADLYGTAFLGEVAGNLIHHQTLTPRGVTFVGQAASLLPKDGETNQQAGSLHYEFVASTDNWFRPVNFVNAPDGTLHVLDMYRETIEHPWSIPDDIKAQLDLESGRDRGRIYRLAPIGFKLPAPPKLSQATTAELVKQLASPKSWWRDTAHRLLLERRDPAAEPLLREIALAGQFAPLREPRTASLQRLHALHLLTRMKLLAEADWQAVLSDRTPAVVEHAIRLAEPLLAEHASLRNKVIEAARSPEQRLRFQAVFSLGPVTRTPEGTIDETVVAALIEAAQDIAGDDLLRTAILVSAAEVAPAMLSGYVRERQLLRQERLKPLDERDTDSAQVVRELAFIVGARAKPAEIEEFFASIDKFAESGGLPRTLIVATAGFGDGLKRANQSLAEMLKSSKSEGAKEIRAILEEALISVADSGTSAEKRRAALPLLAFAPFDSVRQIAEPLLSKTQSAESQAIGAKLLAAQRHVDVPKLLLANIRTLAPEARGEAIETLLSRPDAHVALLDAVQRSDAALSDIPHVRRNLLVRSANAAVKERAVALFSAALASRQKVIDSYRAALLTLKPDRANGEKIFKRECQSCHKVGDLGTEVGPNLRTIRHRAPDEIVLHILDPNREVSPNFVAYVVTTDEGRVAVGLIAEESANSVTLLTPKGTRETILRANIDELAATGKSLMPEGLEEKIKPQEMTDLLEWLLR